MKYSEKRRFAFIETCLYWGVGVTAKVLGSTFGIARQNAQAVLKRYKDRYPDAILYHPKLKKNIAQEGFFPDLISPDPQRYLDYLRGNTLANYYWEEDDWSESIEVVDATRHIKPDFDHKAVRLVINAIQYKQVLSIYYFSKNMTQYLIISPLHLVYAGGRYHVRAYSHTTDFHLDLVLTRMRGAEIAQGYDWVEDERDKEWHQLLDLKFTPNPELPDQVKKAITYDYALQENTYTIQAVRKPLIHYVERDMLRIDLRYNMPLWVRLEEIAML